MRDFICLPSSGASALVRKTATSASIMHTLCTRHIIIRFEEQAASIHVCGVDWEFCVNKNTFAAQADNVYGILHDVDVRERRGWNGLN